MEKEQNSPKTVVIDYFTRIRIFASYIGAGVFRPKYAFIKEQRGTLVGVRSDGVFMMCGDPNLPEIIEVQNQRVYIELKSLGGISEEDKTELQKIIGFSHWINIKSFINEVTGEKNVLGAWGGPVLKVTAAFDFLRSRGYALPTYGYSVEQLEAAGIYKITDK